MTKPSPSPKRIFKSSLYGQFARIGKALASAPRLELMELLAQGERNVEALATEAGLTVANTSQHLQVLRQAGLVAVRREGLFVRYCVADVEVVRLLLALRTVAEQRLAEVDHVVRDFFGRRDEFQPVAFKELIARAGSGEVVVLDVRPALEYQAGHIAGSISLPVSELKRRLRELPRRQEYVAYCRGPYCVYADEAVKMLRANGRRARRLAGGYPEWLAASLPVEPRAASARPPRRRIGATND
jgi:rhodanese-related sulfurtransferase/DNA-binding transcriptional ArsR family regulator